MIQIGGLRQRGPSAKDSLFPRCFENEGAHLRVGVEEPLKKNKKESPKWKNGKEEGLFVRMPIIKYAGAVEGFD